MHVRKQTVGFLVGTLLLFFGLPVVWGSPFEDVRPDDLFEPHINKLYEYHLIDGKSPTTFSPDETINRAEMAKLTTVSRLMEVYRNTVPPPSVRASTYSGLENGFEHQPFLSYRRSGSATSGDKEAGKQLAQQLDFRLAINDLLAPYYSCQNAFAQPILGVQNICSQLRTHGTEFLDVSGKPFECASTNCEPWYGPFVYYAAYQGFVRGVNASQFKPSDPIRRLHALKMLVVDNGNIQPETDPRFQRLSALAESRESLTPKCLKGSESFILNNAGASSDPVGADRLLKYALLADRLDFFGAKCEGFGSAKTPQARADYLNGYLTRKEAARFFAISMNYPEVNPIAETDPTINDLTQNEWGIAGEPYRYPFVEVPEASKSEGVISESRVQDEEPTVDNKNPGDPKGITKTVDVATNDLRQNYPAYRDRGKSGWSIDDLAAGSQSGRCCPTKALTSACQTIQFADYTIAQSSEPGAYAVKGPLWNAATQSNTQCWIPLDDLYDGFTPIATQTSCQLSATERKLLEQYLNQSYQAEVTEIWLSNQSKSLKMFMQLGLDLARTAAQNIEPMLTDPNPNCNALQTQSAHLKAGHTATKIHYFIN